MRLLSQLFLFGGGLLLALLGIPGVDEVTAAWGDWFDLGRAVLGNPVGYAATVLVGVVLMTTTATQFLLERKLASRGGPSGREYPATLGRWRGVERFRVIEAAWLWNSLEPIADPVEKTPAHPTLKRLEQALRAHLPKGVEIAPAWEETSLTRQQWVDLCIQIEEWPPFLFPRRLRGVPAVSDSGYQSITFTEFSIVREYNQKNPQSEISNDYMAETMVEWLKTGAWEAVGRERVGGILYQRVAISRRWWHRVNRGLFDFNFGKREFEGIQVRQVK